MVDLRNSAESLMRRFSEIAGALNEQKEKFGGLMSELKALADDAEGIGEENKKLAEENKRLQAELAAAKKS